MANIKEIIQELKNNKIVCVPTDTVYGLAALATPENAKAIAKLKGNDLNKNYTIMVKNKNEALKLWKHNPLVNILVEKHFPGDLTIIAKAKKGNDYIGIRIPDDKALLEIIKSVGPIFATSTNKSGKKPLKNLKEINKIFPKIKILDGKCGGKKPSTIVKITNLTTEIIRQGDKVL